METEYGNERKGIITQLVNVRHIPSFDGRVLATLKKGSKVRIVDEVEGFYRIKMDGFTSQNGFIPSRCCNELT